VSGVTIDPRKAWAIAGVALRLLFRDRIAGFFVFLFPLALVLILGSVFGGGSEPPIGVSAPGRDPLAAELVEELRANDDVEVDDYDTAGDLRAALERGRIEAGMVVPGDYGDRLRRGGTAEVRVLVRPGGVGASLQPVVQQAVRQQATRLQAARFGVEHGAGDFDRALDAASELAPGVPRVGVQTTTVGDQLFPDTLGRYDIGASSQLVLFMFVTGIASSSLLVQARRQGVVRRMLSTPTSMATVLAGETLARFATVAFQGVYIMVVSWLLFGVDWGDPVGAVALLVAFGLVATGAGLLAGTLFENDEQAGSIGVFAGLGLAALGGSMAPLEVFSPLMRDIAHVSPHAWANDGFAELVRRNGTVVDILPELAVLVGMGLAVIALATWWLRRSLTR
jgi:ABC-2 type transport system permease protein